MLLLRTKVSTQYSVLTDYHMSSLAVEVYFYYWHKGS